MKEHAAQCHAGSFALSPPRRWTVPAPYRLATIISTTTGVLRLLIVLRWGNDRGASYGESAIRSYGKSLFLQIVGLIFWFSRNRLVGSYLFLSASSRP
jgi:hypothetical protein